MKKPTIEEYVRKRDIAVASLDVDALKEFHSEMTERGITLPPLPSDEVLEISIRKMACEITTMPMGIKLKASEWLLSRGYRPCVFDCVADDDYCAEGEHKEEI